MKLIIGGLLVTGLVCLDRAYCASVLTISATNQNSYGTQVERFVTDQFSLAIRYESEEPSLKNYDGELLQVGIGYYPKESLQVHLLAGVEQVNAKLRLERPIKRFSPFFDVNLRSYNYDKIEPIVSTGLEYTINTSFDVGLMINKQETYTCYVTSYF